MFSRVFYYIRYHLLKFRFCYQFMLSHKPICDMFKEDTIVILKHIYVCRSCFFVYSGIVLVLILNSFINFKYMNYFLFAAPLVILLSYPKIYNKLPRIIKDNIRMISGGIVGQSIILGFKGYFFYSIAIFIILFLFKKIFNIIRKSNALNACNACSELVSGHICSGYQKQAEKFRIFEEAFCKSRIPVNRRFEYD